MDTQKQPELDDFPLETTQLVWDDKILEQLALRGYANGTVEPLTFGLTDWGDQGPYYFLHPCTSAELFSKSSLTDWWDFYSSILLTDTCT